MESRILVKIVWLLAVLGLCYGSSIVPTRLETRLCRAQFVFKFQVVSTARKVGCAGGILKTIAPLTNTYPTATTTATLPQSTTNITTAKLSNLHRILNIQPSTGQGVPYQSTVSLPQSRQKRCHQVQHQSILIPGNSVFRGKDKLKKINSVKELKIKDIYYSYIRLDLNFEKELPYEDFLFIGRQVGKIGNQVFLSNPATVVSWNTTLEQKMKNFDFVKDCKSRNSPTRPVLAFEP